MKMSIPKRILAGVVLLISLAIALIFTDQPTSNPVAFWCSWFLLGFVGYLISKWRYYPFRDFDIESFTDIFYCVFFGPITLLTITFGEPGIFIDR